MGNNKLEGTMSYIYLAIFALLFGLFLFGVDLVLTARKKSSDTEWTVGAIWCFVFMFFFIGLFVLHTVILHRNQVADFEQVKFYKQTEQIYKNKADALTTQFASHLASTYPNLEKEIFKNIAPGQVSLYMAKYPDLQSSKTLLALVEQISKLQTDYYNQQIEREKILATMRYRPKSPFVVQSFIPAAPTE